MSVIEDIFANRDIALTPAAPGEFSPETCREKRIFQGIPGIEAGDNGLLYAVWYGGGEGEGPDNYTIFSVSRDCGRSWREVQCVAPAGLVRAYDPVLWFDPQGRLWWFWSQAYSPKVWENFDGRGGVFCCFCENPDAEMPVWSAPRRIAEGVMMNKPVVDSAGNWLLPTAIWSHQPEYLAEEERKFAYSNVTISRDNGETFELLGSADVPERTYDEHCIIELKDGRLWMLVRCRYGIGESFSSDGGKNWTPGRPTVLGGPNSRFAIRRLHSGKLLLINHRSPVTLPGEEPRKGLKTRTDLTAWISDDDGSTWRGGMLISGERQISYPDLTQDKDGRIYVVYDQARLTSANIWLASFTEEDVAAGRLITPGSYLNLLISSTLPAKK